MDHGGCRISTRRESTRAATGLLQHEQKNSGIAYGNGYSDTVRRSEARLHDQNQIVAARDRSSSQTFVHVAKI
jgi:hypothetical protein